MSTRKLTVYIACALLLLISLLSFILAICGYQSSNDNPFVPLILKVPYMIYSFVLVVFSLFGLHAIYRSKYELLRMYSRWIFYLTLISLSQLLLSTSNLFLYKEHAINYCFYWVATHPSLSPVSPDCESAINISAWILFGFYTCFISIQIWTSHTTLRYVNQESNVGRFRTNNQIPIINPLESYEIQSKDDADYQIQYHETKFEPPSPILPENNFLRPVNVSKDRSQSISPSMDYLMPLGYQRDRSGSVASNTSDTPLVPFHQ
ncbi:hypothetical protein BC833DRAFT_607133 [Globomyces pollinis-pini]|nr:hypothetical protein BC833DRAFT_607133 [Globomyces pollinis-pini]